MELWAMWLGAIKNLLAFFSNDLALGGGLGVIAMTLALRGALFPISWSNAYRGCIRQRVLQRIQPELAELRLKHADEPGALAQATIALYRKNGLTPIDGRSVLGGIAQLPLFLGVFQALRDGSAAVRFLWVPNLSRPDVALAVIAGLTTALMMAVNPDLPEHLRWFLIAIPSVFAVIAALKFCSALALYWATSNCFSALQTLAVHRAVASSTRSQPTEAKRK